METWNVTDSLKLYNVESWGGDYFNILPNGHLAVYPRRYKGQGVDLKRIVEEIRGRKDLSLPCVIRFQDVLRDRVNVLNETFAKTIDEAGYKGRYTGVYPIKVNQLQEVVEEITDAGFEHDFGLEAGSKAELSAVLAMETSKNSLIICNGYKDDEYIRLALLGRKLEKKVIVVVEKLSELFQVLDASEKYGIEPMIGIRCKLYSKGSGRWEASGGEFAKFGLTTPELLYAYRVLEERGLQHCLQLIHFHIGSQITNIRRIKEASKEIARIYAKLKKMGAGLKYIDVGGGLGVDYDGSRTDFHSSMNYSLAEYVSDVVYSIQEVCTAEQVEEPNIVSESGRAMVAHHSVLVVNVFGSIEVGAAPVDLALGEDSEHEVVKEMRYVFQNLSNKKLLEQYHDAIERKEEAITMFNLGILSLEDRAKVEHMFWEVCKYVVRQAKTMKYVPDELEELKSKLADQYLCNFSVFQSLLDHWAIESLFPILPIHRLNERPTREATLVDITCDSDGKISKFIDLRDIKDTLRLHELKENDPYYLGLFLTGAYQDIMGDYHNLFGRVNEVHVFLDEEEPGGYFIEETIQGSKIADALEMTQYSPKTLERKIKSSIDRRVRKGAMKAKEGALWLEFYESVLSGYTYMTQETPVRTTRMIREQSANKTETASAAASSVARVGLSTQVEDGSLSEAAPSSDAEM